MRINCVSCGHEINLNHDLFDDYEGPVKCFVCSTMMEIIATEGVINSIDLLSILPRSSTVEHAEQTH